jgi:hypothetical protein
MCHQNVFQGENVSFPEFISEITSEFLYSFKKNRPYPQSIKRLILQGQFCSVVGNILKHTNSSKIVVDILAIIAGVFVNCVKDSDKVLLTQFVYVMIDNQF